MRNCTQLNFNNIRYNQVYKDSHTYTNQSHNYPPWRFTRYVILRRSSLYNQNCRLLISVVQVHSFLTLYICTSVTQYLSVVDNERDAVLLHVSASSERQEYGTKQVQWRRQQCAIFLISNIRRVLNVLCFLLSNPRRLNFICRGFGTFCLFHLHRQGGMKND